MMVVTNPAHSAYWRGLLARCLVLASIFAVLGTVPGHGEEGARPGIARRCLGPDCPSAPVRGVTIFHGLVLDYEVIDGLAVHGGDMVLGTAEEAAAAAPSREPEKREATPGPVRRDLYPIEDSFLWPDGRVPYMIDEEIEGEDLEVIHAAIEEWNSKTVITWFPATDEEDYAQFLPKESERNCRSDVGRRSPTRIWTGGCNLSSTIHEMGHVVGLFHEHQRPDRDRFTSVAPLFFSVGQARQWWQLRERASFTGSQWFERPYDYRSIMHYRERPRNVQSIPPGIRLTGTSLSAGDIDGVARLYGMHLRTITVSTNPAGLKVIVDGRSVTTPAKFDWPPGSVHTLEAPLLQHETREGWRARQYVFGRWSDGGGRKHTVKAGSDTTWFEANLIPLNEVRSNVYPSHAGTVALNPESPDGWYAEGSLVELTPLPTEGTHYQFARWWAGPTLLPQGPVLRTEVYGGYDSRYLQARFRRQPFYWIRSNMRGTRIPVEVNGHKWLTPAAFQPSELPAGSKVSVPETMPVMESLGSGGRYRFTGWSDGGEREHEIEAPARGGSLTFHVQREFELDTHTNSGEIVVSPESEDGFYPSGSQVQLTAVPEAGRHFVGWEHDLSGTATTQSVIMDRDRRVSAKFSRVEPILLRDGEYLQTDSLTGRHFVRVPDGTSQVAVRFESSAPTWDAEFSVYSGFRSDELGSTRLSESDTITITREALSRTRDRARGNPSGHSHHLRIQQRDNGSLGLSGRLLVSIQRDWIAGFWPRAFTMVSSVGWSRPVRQTMRITPVREGLPHVRYRIVSDQHWLEAFPSEWTSAQGEVEIAVTANGAALAAEAYRGRLKILTVNHGDSPTGGTPTGIEIPVHFVVKPSDGAEGPTVDESSKLSGGDDHGDTRGAATEIAAGGVARGRLERVGDEDWFRFRTTGVRTWVTAYTASGGDTVGELHTAGGSTVSDDDSGTDGNFRVVAKVPAGTHYVRVSGFGTPDYTLMLEAVADDHGDTQEAATEIATGGVARGRLERFGDEDWFRFRTTGAQTWVTAYTVSRGDTVGELHTAGGSTVLDDDSGIDGNFRVVASVPAGVHYLRVSGSGTSGYLLLLDAGSFPMEFVRIPAGSFVMGSPEDEEGRHSRERQHNVRISHEFWLGKYEVTQREWEAVMGTNPSGFSECGARCPVERVSWDDVQEFIRRLNELESGSGYVYRLPTEAEWEYAARAGTTGARHGELDSIAWYRGNGGRTTHPVGEKLANAWGLHDMLGNVWEWTADWYSAYPSVAVTNPRGPSTGSERVIRGGSGASSARDVRSAHRGGSSPDRRGNGLGFRLVRTTSLVIEASSFPMEFERIPAGSFVMGSPEDEEGRHPRERQHNVRISQGFWMGKYEVTQGEWGAVMGTNPSGFPECGARCPVERVSWDDVQEFIRTLNQRESASGYVYRLPTEAEWEYAARAGTTGARHGELDSIAWYRDNSGRTTHPVGQKRANAWGLHDMLGNVWEWVADWHAAYPSGAVTDPRGTGTGTARVIRGLGWSISATSVRSAYRVSTSADARSRELGFRLVRTE